MIISKLVREIIIGNSYKLLIRGLKGWWIRSIMERYTERKGEIIIRNWIKEIRNIPKTKKY